MTILTGPRSFIRLLVVVFAVMAAPAALAQLVPSAPVSEAPATSEAAAPTEAQQALRDLVKVLENEETRAALIEEIDRVTDVRAEDAQAAEEADVNNTLGQIFIDTVQAYGTAIGENLSTLSYQLSRLPAKLAELDGNFFAIAAAGSMMILPAALIAYGIWFAIRGVGILIRRTLVKRLTNLNVFLKFLLALGMFAAHFVGILVAFLASAIGAGIIAEATGSSTRYVEEFIAAFLLVETLCLTARMVFMPNAPQWRLLPLKTDTAKALSWHIRIVVMWLGYGLGALMPAINEEMSFPAGHALSIYIYMAALVYVTWVTLGSRNRVARAIHNPEPDAPAQSRFIGVVAQLWYWPVLAFLLVTAIVVLTRPLFRINSYLESALGLALSIGAIVWIGGVLLRVLQRRVRLPKSISKRLPTLERHVNHFVPRAVMTLRVLMVAFTAVLVLDTIGWIDVDAFFAHPVGARISQAVINIIIISAIAFVLWVVIEAYIEYRLGSEGRKVPTARERTLLILFKNAAAVTVLLFAGFFTLSEMGVNMAPLLASAGVAGIAIGFGAQKLVQDVITGMFIQIEGAIDVGDVVQVGGIAGVVERLTIRSVALRDLKGVYHIVPFSSVDTVSNHMRGFAYVVSDIGVAYREDTEEVKQAMFDAFEELKKDEEMKLNILDDELEWMGLNSFGPSEVVLRARIKTLPGKQWDTGRAYNAVIKRIFDERGIEIPFPHQTVYFGADKQGKAPPAHIITEGEDQSSS